MDTPFGELPDHLRAELTMAEQHEYLRRKRSRRWFLTTTALAAGGVGAAGLWVQSRLSAGTAIGARHVSFGTDPAHQAMVSFSVPANFGKATVQYGLDSNFGATAGVNALTVPGVATVYGHSLLSGLSPAHRYFYRVVVDGQHSAVSSVTTAPAVPAAFTFTAFGDEAVSDAAVAIVGQIRKIAPAFHLLAGDICYADTTGGGAPNDTFDPTVWDRWLGMIEPVAASTPWMCATGNHDMEPGYGTHGYSGYLNRFPTPANGAPGCPSTYTFRYGNVAIIALDANDVSYEIPHNLRYSKGRQTAWLATTLSALRAPGSGIDFIVALFHHCTYSRNRKHGSDQGIRDHWVPLFDQYRVDLVINGHAHLYERTYPIRHGQLTTVVPRGGTVDSERAGTTYITAGGGGATAEKDKISDLSAVVQLGGTTTQEPSPWSAPTRTSVHAFLAVSVTPPTPGRTTSMHIRALSSAGAPLDEVTLTRQTLNA